MKIFKFLEKDSIKLGLIISILIPLTLFALVMLVKFNGSGFFDLRYLPDKKIIHKIFSLCVFPNGIIFYFYILKDRLKTMRGMVFGTISMAAIMGILFLIC